MAPIKIAVVGCGAMGSIYAGLLAEGGNDVLVIDANPINVATINQRGLRIEGASGDRAIAIAACTSIPKVAVDLVIVAVKATQVAGLAPELRVLLSPDTIVLTIQNGVGSAEVLASFVPAQQLAIGIAGGFGAETRGPAHVFHGSMNMIRMGPFADLSMVAIERIATIWRQAGFTAEAVSNVLAMQWEKLICNAAYSAPCALTGMTVGEIMDDLEMGPVSRAAATEACAIACALDIGVKVSDPVKMVREFGASVRHAKPSLLQDHEKQRRSEIDVINGAVTRVAARLGVAVPVNSVLVALIKQRERSFPGPIAGR